jgi:hypothetical protein
MLIGGLLKVTVHRPGWLRSVLNCEDQAWRISFSLVMNNFTATI